MVVVGSLMAMAALAATPLPVLRAEVDPNHESFDPSMCSLYCVAYPDVKVSEHLPRHGRARYDAGQLADGELHTAWITQGGPGWFEFTFSPDGLIPDFSLEDQGTGVNSLYISNGYNKSPDHWRDHSRLHRIDLSVDGRPVASLELKDDPRPQFVALPPTLLRPGMRFRFTVRSVFTGARFDETAVSEARLDGYGHH